MQKIIVLTLLIILCFSLEAKEASYIHSCIPAKLYDINIDKNSRSSNVSEEDFNEVLDTIEKIYSPVVSTMGANLKIHRFWEDGTFNAYAGRTGSDWELHIFGGIARHELVTKDVLALISCHELGHHIGGTPRKTDLLGGQLWGSSEGQADYFAASKCMKEYIKLAKSSKLTDIHPAILDKCGSIYSSNESFNMCARIAVAGHKLSSLFAILMQDNRLISFDEPDTYVTRKTIINSYPSNQCRLDTFFAGALCNKSSDYNVDYSDTFVGYCNRQDDMPEMARPLCWFNPEDSFNSNLDDDNEDDEDFDFENM